VLVCALAAASAEVGAQAVTDTPIVAAKARGDGGLVTDVRQFGAACDGVTDDLAAFNAALAAGNGRTIFLPDDCLLRLSAPPDAFPVTTGTRSVSVQCASRSGSSGFTLAHKTCRGGGMNGKGCARDGDCPSGTCDGTFFAPAAGVDYRVLWGEALTLGVSIEDCFIKTNQVGPATCVTGTRAGLACSSDTTSASTGCPGAACPGTDCCNGQPVNPAGPGLVDPVVFDQVYSSAVVDGISVQDHRIGNVMVAIQTGVVRDTQVVGPTTIGPRATPIQFRVSDGIVCAAAGCDFILNSVRASRYGLVTGSTGSRLSFNTLQAAAGAGDVGVWVRAGSNQNWVTHNFIVNFFTGIGGDVASNLFISHNRVFGGGGPKLVIPGGAGWKIDHNYFAWGTGPPHPIVKFGNDAPGAQAGGTGHVELDANTLFSDSGAVAAIQFPDVGKRCCVSANCAASPGTKRGLACARDADCTDAGPSAGSCAPVAHADFAIKGNMVLTPIVGVDFSALGSASSTTAGPGTIALNVFSSARTGVKLPATTGKVTELDLNLNSFHGTADSLLNWDWRFGSYEASVPLNAGDESPLFAFMRHCAEASCTGGAAATIYQAAVVETHNDNAVTTAPASTTGPIAGVFVSDAADGALARVAVAGVTKCAIATNVARGDLLCLSTTAAGKFCTCGSGGCGTNVGADLSAAAVAHASGTAPANVLCQVKLVP
jgi:hypothetical protein